MSDTVFAPYHIVCLDGGACVGAGKFYHVGVAATCLDGLRRQFPLSEWAILSDGGLLYDQDIERTPPPLLPKVRLSFSTKAPKPPKRPKIKLLRKAA